MNAKEAADKAIANVEKLYARVLDCRLEEFAKDGEDWKITLSFIVEEIPDSGNRLVTKMRRLYKLLTISDNTGEVVKMNSVKA